MSVAWLSRASILHGPVCRCAAPTRVHAALTRDQGRRRRHPPPASTACDRSSARRSSRAIEPPTKVPLQLILLHGGPHLAKIEIGDAAGHGRITCLCGVPDLGAIPALQHFALLVEGADLAVAFHPPMPPEFRSSEIGHKRKNGSPVSEETNEPFQEQTVWIRL